MDIVNDKDLKEVVSTGLAFIRAVTERYGVDNGSSLYNDMIANLDAEAKGAIMFAMLTGRNSLSVTLRSYPPDQKIPVIKAIRVAAGLGLKEAKDLSDMVQITRYPNGYQSPPTVTMGSSVEVPTTSHEAREQLLRDFRDIGAIAD